MNTINIDASEDPVILKMKFFTPQQFFYEIIITDGGGNVKFEDEGRWDGKKKFDLGPGEELVDLYLRISWTVVDLNGAGNQFRATATATQNDVTKPNLQLFKDITTGATFSGITYAYFV